MLETNWCFSTSRYIMPQNRIYKLRLWICTSISWIQETSFFRNAHNKHINSSVPPTLHEGLFDKQHQHSSCPDATSTSRCVPPAYRFSSPQPLQTTMRTRLMFGKCCSVSFLSLATLLTVRSVSFHSHCLCSFLLLCLPDLCFTLPLFPETSSLVTSCSISQNGRQTPCAATVLLCNIRSWDMLPCQLNAATKEQ